MRHYNIPIFIPELACPHRCVFCNQHKISGTLNIPKPNEISSHIDTYLSTIKSGSLIQIAFFGGSFTGIDEQLQEQYLKIAYSYVEQGLVDGIRLSTRPDYISRAILDRLVRYGVRCVELGAQSFDAEVLHKSGRGHTVADIENSSALIHEYGIELGLQMMLGLPGDTKEKCLQTARSIVALQASNTRIYPALVIKDTPMAEMYARGDYQPLDMDSALEWAMEAYHIFIENNVTVLRVGLHPSEELDSAKSLIAGPYHPSYKELVLSRIWQQKFEQDLPKDKGKLNIKVSPSQINYAVGRMGCNRERLKQKYGWIKITPDSSLSNYEMHVSYC